MGIEEQDKSKLLRFIGPPLYVSFAEFYGLNEADTETAIEHFRSIYDNEGYKESPLYEGIEEVLSALKEKVNTYLSSHPSLFLWLKRYPRIQVLINT